MRAPRALPGASTPRTAHVFLTGSQLAVTLVMAWPFVNYRALGSGSYQGDARLIIWTLAWDNHAVLSRLPLFDSNIFCSSSFADDKAPPRRPDGERVAPLREAT